MPTARMAVTLNRAIQEIAATFSMGSQPQSAKSQKRAARNALARIRLIPPIEEGEGESGEEPADRQAIGAGHGRYHTAVTCA